MQIQELYSLYLKHPSVQTDTRKIQKGDLFFALKGPNFNGNTFAQQAIEKGAAFAIVDEAISTNVSSNQIILVDDVLLTLQALARYHRQQFTIPFIAITGSNGKTTTKELVYAVLSTKYTTYTTQGNLNNHIGIPLTILSIQPNAEMAVIEMGANHQKEIAGYCTYVLPTHGIITNCGKAHLEGFGGVEGVRKGKGELFDYLRATNGTAFINWDYDYFHSMSTNIAHMVKYGTLTGDIIGQVISSEPFLNVQIQSGFESSFAINTQLVGAYNVANVLTAVIIGKYFGISINLIQKAIEGYAPSNSRSQLIQKDTNHIVLDAYNANPTSMKAAIENFAKLSAPKKVLLIGGMMELGEDSIVEHQAIANFIDNFTWEKVIFVGGDFQQIVTKQPSLFFPSSLEAKSWYRQQSFTNTYLLIKGSRSMQMEKIISD